ncbi:MAG: hypothetical protein U0Q18_24540 [Bryobacteraceae bacterium]
MRIPTLVALLAQICAAAPKVTDESRRFPSANQTGTQLVEKNLLGKAFMPGGTLANYKKGAVTYSMFIAKLPSPQDAAFLLLDWKKALTGAHLVPSFGGYFGLDAGRPVFVFPKGGWIAGVVGLPEKDADLQARALAAHLN